MLTDPVTNRDVTLEEFIEPEEEEPAHTVDLTKWGGDTPPPEGSDEK